MSQLLYIYIRFYGCLSFTEDIQLSRIYMYGLPVIHIIL